MHNHVLAIPQSGGPVAIEHQTVSGSAVYARGLWICGSMNYAGSMRERASCCWSPVYAYAKLEQASGACSEKGEFTSTHSLGATMGQITCRLDKM